ncbi:MAG: hypothetical protein HPY89_11235 [Pelotomaculum sp.]|nr:hypothetical protein [Pelotomaculum sp.]
MLKKGLQKVKKILKSNRGDLVTWVIIAVMAGIITVGAITALKPNIQTAQQKTNTMLQSAGSTFTY